jgi:mycoredoxin
MQQVTVYGADWCHDTSNTRELLEEMGVPYNYINVDDDPRGEDFVLEHNAGTQKLPTVDIGGVVLSVPADEELARVLEEKGLMAE